MISMTSIEALMLIGIGTPAALLILLASASVLNRPLWEQWIGRLAAAAMTISFAAITTALLLYLTTGTAEMLVSYGYWSTAHEGGIAIEFLLDGMPATRTRRPLRTLGRSDARTTPCSARSPRRSAIGCGPIVNPVPA